MNSNVVLLLTSLTTLLFSHQTVLGQEEDNDHYAMRFPLRDIAAVKESVDKYTPENPNRLVNEAGLPWLKRAVSMKMREEWIKSSNYWAGYGPETPVRTKILTDAFDALAQSAARKLPKYMPADKKIIFHDPNEEAILKAAISDISDAKIFNIGFSQKDWVIAKDSYNTPLFRDKQGYIYVRYEKNVHPYCNLIQVNLTQQYAGGGTYNASFGKFMLSELCGCPK